MVRALWVALALLCATPAQADSKDLHLGFLGTWEIVDGGRGGGGVELGLNDFLALRGELSGGGVSGTGSFQVLAGPTFVWDVVDWVPAITLLIGGEFGNGAAVMGLGRVEVRKYVARKAWLSLGVGGEIHRNDLQPQVLMSAFWQV